MNAWNQFNGDERNSGMCRDHQDPTRPDQAWVVDLVGPVSCSPVVDRTTVYVGTKRGNLYAFDRKSGRRRWVYETLEAVESTPVVTDESVCCGFADGTVVALSPESGDELWSTTVPAPLEASLAISRPTATSPSVTESVTSPSESANHPGSNGLLVVGHDDGLSALDILTGENRWNHDTNGEIVGSPAIGDETVFAGSAYGAVVALERDSGEEKWTAPTDGVPVDGPTATDDRIYVADDAGTMIAMAQESGQSWFTYEIDAAFTSTPTIVDDTVFIPAADGYLHVTDTTFGTRKLRGWLFAKRGLGLDGIPTGSPVVIGDVLCIADSSGSLYSVDVTDPDFGWHQPIDEAVGHLAVADGRLYAGSVGRETDGSPATRTRRTDRIENADRTHTSGRLYCYSISNNR